jgi:uncharacterized protein YhbP (UPF0306 family)
MSDFLEEAKKIISDNQHMVIATTDGLQPWVSPVFMAYDENYNFYWASERETRHSKLIEKNNLIAIVIFDSNVPEGTGKGVYLEAEALEINDIDELKKIIPLMYDRKQKPHKSVEEFTGGGKRRIYKAVPKKTWVKLSKDARVEIQL